MNFQHLRSPIMNAQPIASLVTQLVQATRSRASRPSQRNLEIYEEVHVKGKSQLEVGAFRGLSQSRVSAICRQVARWRGGQEPGDLGEPQGAAKVRAGRWLTRRRLEEVYGWTLRGLESSGQSQVSQVTRSRDDGPTWRITQRKEQNFNVQWAKVARATVNDLHKLAELEEPESPPSKPRLRQEQADRIVRLVACLRRMVRGTSRATSDCLQPIVEQIVQALAGERVQGSGFRVQEDISSPSFSQTLLDEPVAPSPPLTASVAECANYSIPPAETATVSVSTTTVDDGASPPPAVACSAPPSTVTPSPLAHSAAEKTNSRIVSREAAQRETNRCNDDELRSAQAQVEYYFGIALRPEEIATELKHLRAIQAGRYRMFQFSRQQAEALERWDRATKERGTSTAAKSSPNPEP
jgi:hypothetical protein